MSGDTAMVLSLWGMFSGITAVVWAWVTNRRREKVATLQAEMQAKLLERLSSSQELAEFLKTEAGRRLLEAPVETAGNPYRRILFSTQAGLVGTLLGAGILTARPSLGNAPQDELLVFGTMTLAVGLGFLLSAVASFLLSKAWGLINGRNAEPR